MVVETRPSVTETAHDHTGAPGIEIDFPPVQDPELASRIRTSLNPAYRPVPNELKPHIGKPPENSIPFTGNVLALKDFALDTVLRFDASTQREDGIESITCIGIVQQLKKPDGQRYDAILLNSEEFLINGGETLLATWRDEFTLRQMLHDKVADGDVIYEHKYQIDNVVVVAQGNGARKVSEPRQGLSRFLPSLPRRKPML